MPSLQENIDMLRGRFVRLRVGYGSYERLAPIMDLGPDTLRRFVRGDAMTSTVLQKIEQWCDNQAKNIPLRETEGVHD